MDVSSVDIAALGACLLTLERIVKHVSDLMRERRKGTKLKPKDEQLVDAVVERLKNQQQASTD